MTAEAPVLRGGHLENSVSVKRETDEGGCHQQTGGRYFRRRDVSKTIVTAAHTVSPNGKDKANGVCLSLLTSSYVEVLSQSH